MVIKEALLKLLEVGTRRDGEILLSNIMGMDFLELTLNRECKLNKVQEEKLFSYYERKKPGEPVYYITGSCEFMSLEFMVNKNVLIPRSDTETLVEYVTDRIGNSKKTVLDIGTGSGCIGISIKKYCPNAEVTCLDISEDALKVAEVNAKANGVNIKRLNMDILCNIPDNKFDFIVSNPPYIRPEVIQKLDKNVKDFEPYTALCGGEDGLLFYRRIISVIRDLLNEGGELAFEIGYDQGEEVLALVSQKFNECGIIKDLCKNDRVVWGK